jgi:hypothetical protein
LIERGERKMTKKNENDLSVEERRAIRKEEGLKIDPETAVVVRTFAYTVDPYGIVPDLLPEEQQLSRESFARNKGSDIWVHQGDIPTEIWERIWSKHVRQSASPVGLPGLDFDEEESS